MCFPKLASIGSYTFNYCYSLKNVTLPYNATSIGTSFFNPCYNLREIVIPQSVTSIAANAFANNYVMTSMKFTRSTPPTAVADSFSSLNDDCIIYVPSGRLSAYKSAANYPDSSTYTYVEY